MHASTRKLAVCAALAIVGLVVLRWLGPATRTPGTGPSTPETAPPPPPRVNQAARIRQQWRPGQTYITHLEGTVQARGTDQDWGLEQVITINYVFAAQIERTIESNDGTTIVERRHFRKVHALKFETRLEDVRLRLSEVKGGLLLLLAQIHPPTALVGKVVLNTADGASLKKVLRLLPWVGLPDLEQHIEGSAYRAALQMDSLSGKTVRLTYVDGQGVTMLEPLEGTLTAEERKFLAASVLVSDALFVPEAVTTIGQQWDVPGRAFHAFFDPALRARPGGQVTLERATDNMVEGKLCHRLRVVGGRLTLQDSHPQVGHIGHFDPEGSADYCPQEQLIVAAHLRGKADLERFSKDHLLFQAKFRNQGTVELRYTCQRAAP